MSRAPRYDFRQFLNVRSAYHPSFSPNGARMAFITDITGVPQVWQADGPGRWPDRLTFYEEEISTVAYGVAGNRLVFGMDSGGDERQQLYLLDADGSPVRALTDEPEAIHNWGAWAPDGRRIAFAANRRDDAAFDIYTQRIDGDEASRIFEGGGNYSVSDWSPDGKKLLITLARSNFDHDLCLLELASGEVTALTTQAGTACYIDARWAPDGEGIYVLTDRDREFLAPARLDLDTGATELLEETEWDAEALALSPDGRWLAYALNVDGYSHLILRDLRRGDRMRVEGLPPGVVGARLDTHRVEFSPDGARLAFSFEGARHNPDIWTYEIQSGELVRYTRSSLAGIPRDALADPKLVRYRSFDGLEVSGYLFRPSGSKSGMPTVVYVHGGPESQFRPTFSPVIQYLVHRGYAVFAPNVRGSTGYGNTYMHLDDVGRRMDAVADLKYGVEWLSGDGLADPDRIAVMGGSYGGFMVLAALTTYPELWAAGVDVVGIANFVTFLENTGPWRRRMRQAEYGLLDRDRHILEEISPIHRVDRIEAPLLVIHGANDPRVPVGEAEQIVRSLEKRGHPVEYLPFRDEGHGIVKLENKLVAYPAMGDFLDRHLTA